MATRFYLVPKDGTGVAGDIYRPAYFLDADGVASIAGALICQDYGQEPAFLVTAQVTDGEHARLVGEGVTVLQSPQAASTLDTPVGALFARYLRLRLEEAGFPALWIDRQTTTRAVLRHLQRCVHLAQRLQRFGRLFPPGVTLATPLGQLFPDQRQLLINAALAGGGTGDGLDDTQTLRDALTVLANQLPYPAQLLDVVL